MRSLPVALALACAVTSALTCASILTACTTGTTTGAPRTVTVTPSQPTATGSGAPSTNSGGSSSPVAIPSAHQTKLPGTCDDLLPLSAVEGALGRPVNGLTSFVVGVAEPDIGRIGYLNCRYGLANATAAPLLEIGVSLYRTPAQAAARIPATVADYANHNATSAPVQIAGATGSLLTGGAGMGYTDPTLVAAAAQRTVAITLAAKATTDPTKDLTALATLALTVTG